MRLSKSRVKLLVLVFSIFLLSGCSLFKIPGAVIGGTADLLGSAIGLADKVPWWMWI